MQDVPFPAEYFPTATTVMILETFVVVVLLIGWLFGARRLEFRLHHWAVYSIILVHAVTVGAWMIWRAERLNPFADPVANWYQILHDTLGIIAIALGLIVAVVFLVRRDMPLKLLKRTRPVMILILTLWVITFILGLAAYLVGWGDFLPF
ncbi:MAG: hypothetical protein ACXADS_03055 [Candidatus Thorarchaeota archaeon]|jgi:hypothetical protein